MPQERKRKFYDNSLSDYLQLQMKDSWEPAVERNWNRESKGEDNYLDVLFETKNILDNTDDVKQWATDENLKLERDIIQAKQPFLRMKRDHEGVILAEDEDFRRCLSKYDNEEEPTVENAENISTTVDFNNQFIPLTAESLRQGNKQKLYAITDKELQNFYIRNCYRNELVLYEQKARAKFRIPIIVLKALIEFCERKRFTVVNYFDSQNEELLLDDYTE